MDRVFHITLSLSLRSNRSYHREKRRRRKLLYTHSDILFFFSLAPNNVLCMDEVYHTAYYTSHTRFVKSVCCFSDFLRRSLWPFLFFFFFYPSTAFIYHTLRCRRWFYFACIRVLFVRIFLSPSHSMSNSLFSFDQSTSTQSVPLSHASPFAPHSMRCMCVLCVFINYTIIYWIRMIGVWAYMYSSIFLFIPFLISVFRIFFYTSSYTSASSCSAVLSLSHTHRVRPLRQTFPSQ